MGVWFLTWMRIWIVILCAVTHCNLQSGYKHLGEDIASLF
jgi:hypothetical protein